MLHGNMYNLATNAFELQIAIGELKVYESADNDETQAEMSKS
jgi:hypothetical protein